jgi:hypothetical protein
MPVIACPGCGKQYKIAAIAAGQVAKCACGKRFRLGGAQDKSSPAKPAKPATVATATANRTSASASTKSKPAAQAAPAPADDFWDDAISIADKPQPAAVSSPSGSSAQSAMIKSGGPVLQNLSNDQAEAAPKKKKKKSGGIKWGFDWGKVVAGLASFLIFGGLTVALVMSTGRVSRGTVYLAVPAIAGLFTAINGLMGEEGIW